MRSPFAVAFVSLALLLAAWNPTANAKEGPTDVDRIPTAAQDGDRLTGGSASGAYVKADSIYVLGGPGSLTGKFEDANGLPDWHGWTGLDMSVGPQDAWNTDTYNCQNLDVDQPENHAWWCGKYFEPCEPGDDGAGYGNTWEMSLEFSGTVSETNSPTSVTLHARMNHDLEADYDYLFLQSYRASGWQTEKAYDDKVVGLEETVSFTMDPGDYTGPGYDEIRLRWFVDTDGVWSDEDCIFPTQGAVQIDSIIVYFGEELRSEEYCEPGEQHDWVPTPVPGVGDYARIWSGLGDDDPCRKNYSPQVAFIAHPTTGLPSYAGSSHVYGPGGYIVHPEGGAAGSDHHIKNYVVSPPIQWPGTQYVGGILSFDVYTHENLIEVISPGVFYVKEVRSTTSDDPADLSDAGWRNDNFVSYGGPYYTRRQWDFSVRLTPGTKWFQVALGVYELGYAWGYTGTDGTPAPYFDNVAVKVFAMDGPAMATREIELANDGFPESGILDPVDLGANSVRFDMAKNIAPSADLRRDPGDSIVVDIVPVRSGSQLVVPPEIHWTMKANQLFNPYRTSGYPISGSAPGLPTFDSFGSPVYDRWNFDLPDTGFLFPGDVLHYYIRSADDLGGASILPADTTGFGNFSDPNRRYHSSFTFRALPSLLDTGGYHPPILLWNDQGGRGGENEWYTALDNLGYREGIDYDVYYTNAPSSGLGNGLGNRATIDQIAGFGTLLYTSGNLSTYTITGPNFTDAPGDRALLDEWFYLEDKNALFTGDNLAFDMVVNQEQTWFIDRWFPLNFVVRDVTSLTGGSSACRAITGNVVFPAGEQWTADHGCPWYNTFDAVEPTASSLRIAEFLDPDGITGQYTYAASLLHEHAESRSQVIYTPYDFMYIGPGEYAKAPDPSAERTAFLESVLSYFEKSPGGGSVRVPSLIQSSVEMGASGFITLQASPAGRGDRLDNTQLWDGQPGSPISRTDATITVTMRNDAGQPIVDYPHEDLWLETTSGNMVHAPGMIAADHATDDDGRTTFSGPVACGGSGDGLRVIVAGTQIVHDPLPILVNSTDMNGDFVVNLTDIVIFRGIINGTYDQAADFHRDGVIDILDLILLTRTLGDEAP